MSAVAIIAKLYDNSDKLVRQLAEKTRKGTTKEKKSEKNLEKNDASNRKLVNNMNRIAQNVSTLEGRLDL